MGRPSNAEIAARNAASPHPRLIYTPQDEGDPAVTVWNRHRFMANVPTEIRDIRNGLSAQEMIERAKGNKSFQIEGVEKVVKAVAVPNTSEQYRAYAANWIRDAKSSTQLVSRWDSEKELREDCGCGTDDNEFCAGLFNPRKAALEKAEKLAAAQADN